MLTDWRKLLFWGCCALFVLWILWWASSGYPLEGQICASDDAKNNCASYNILSYSAWQIAQFASHWSVLIAAIATVAIAVFTLTLWRSTDRLWALGNDTAQKELRAFVFAEAMSITPQTLTRAYTGAQGTYEVPISWNVSVIWENGGQTRTKNLFIHVSFGFFVGEMPDDWPFPDYGDQNRIPAMIGPKATIHSGGFEFKVEDTSVRSVSEGQMHLYIWGWAEYDDVFENTPRHRTEFCNEMFIVGPFPVKAQLIHRTHRLHNAADEDCKYPLKTPRA